MQLAQTLESEVIPRLVVAHRENPSGATLLPGADEIAAFVHLLREGTDAEIDTVVAGHRSRGLAVEDLFLRLLSPSAHLLGELWLADRCDFSSVTVCLGRLQRLLRQWSQAFAREAVRPANGRRILLGQHPGEQHSFGLSMVAEFFWRDGWDVVGGVGGAVPDPSILAARDWFDVIGFSVGSETRINWLREQIAAVRAASCNRSVVVLVGGPLFALQPELVRSVDADASSSDAGGASQLAEKLIAARQVRT